MAKSVIRVGVHEAKTRLSELIRVVAGGQEVDILRGGIPVAKLVAYAQSTPRTFGEDEGRFVVPEDFDASLPDEIESAFYQ